MSIFGGKGRDGLGKGDRGRSTGNRGTGSGGNRSGTSSNASSRGSSRANSPSNAGAAGGFRRASDRGDSADRSNAIWYNNNGNNGSSPNDLNDLNGNNLNSIPNTSTGMPYSNTDDYLHSHPGITHFAFSPLGTFVAVYEPYCPSSTTQTNVALYNVSTGALVSNAILPTSQLGSSVGGAAGGGIASSASGTVSSFWPYYKWSDDERYLCVLSNTRKNPHLPFDEIRIYEEPDYPSIVTDPNLLRPRSGRNAILDADQMRALGLKEGTIEHGKHHRAIDILDEITLGYKNLGGLVHDDHPDLIHQDAGVGEVDGGAAHAAAVAVAAGSNGGTSSMGMNAAAQRGGQFSPHDVGAASVGLGGFKDGDTAPKEEDDESGPAVILQCNNVALAEFSRGDSPHVIVYSRETTSSAAKVFIFNLDAEFNGSQGGGNILQKTLPRMQITKQWNQNSDGPRSDSPEITHPDKVESMFARI